MKNNRVSVIMPTLNGERHIEAALRSLLRETQVQLDIIVVDDGSTDQTAEIVRRLSLSNRCIRLISGSHGGVSSARNTGLAAVPPKNDFVTFLDCDDLNVPGRIGRQLGILLGHPGLRFVIGLLQLFEAIDEERCIPLPGSRTMRLRGVSLTSVLFAKDVFEQLGGFCEDMQSGEDVEFILRLLEARIPYSCEDEVAVMYRRHQNNMTNDTAKTRRGLADAIRRSLARRRVGGSVTGLGDLFKERVQAEKMFRHE
jgi:glycosyltransferase involved in cell wall biosynthesis